MSLRHTFRALYSLDTLDTRFTTSSKTPVAATSQEHGVSSSKPAIQSGDANVQARARPSKWNTKEYYLYYLVFLTMVPMMFYIPYSVSRPSDPQYHKFAPLLSEGWIPGRKVDNSDAQYAGFRNNVPYLALLVIFHPLLRRVVTAVIPSRASAAKTPESQADSRLASRVSFDFVFSCLFLLVLHGFSAFKVFLILYINYTLTKTLPKKYIPAAAWIFNIVTLFANETFEGYHYSRLLPYLNIDKSWGHWLDSYGGLVPRWEVHFNISVLRLISYDMDYYWALGQRAASPIEKKQLDPSTMSERDRIRTSHPLSTYNFTTYVSYALYSPLYLAGPILPFNDYIAQLRHTPPSITARRTSLYAVRFLLSLLTMELVLHFIYAVAISHSNPDWSLYTPFELSMLGYFNLHIIWLKLLLPWRFFRLWALADGVDPPENMIRCMSNNYSTVSFWRSWHRSFNRWIVRYIYIPLGGSADRAGGQLWYLLNTLAVFTFVALWHDISLRLLTWSWLIVLFLVPEIFCSMVLFPACKYRDQPERYRIIAGVGAVGNVLMMMAANLVGFALGLDGLQGLVNGIVSGWHGWLFLVGAAATLFVGVQVMFEVREEEKRMGVDLKC